MSDAIIRFTVPLPPPALRRNSETRNQGYKSKLKGEYQEQVWCAGWERDFVSAYMPWPRARVHYTWYSTHRTDEDNIIASMKPALDVLHTKGARPLGIILDDSGAIVTAEWKRERVRSKARVELTIEKVIE